MDTLDYWRGRTGRAFLFFGGVFNVVTLLARLPMWDQSQVGLVISAVFAWTCNLAIRRSPRAMRVVGWMVLMMMVVAMVSGVRIGGKGLAGLTAAPIGPLLGAVLLGTPGIVAGTVGALATLLVILRYIEPPFHTWVYSQATMTGVLVVIMLAMQNLVLRLINSMETKERLMNLVAHELRGGLTVVKARGQLVRMCVERGNTPDKELLRNMDQGVARMERIIADLVDAARLQSHRLTIERSRCDVRELCLNAADEQEQAHQRTITLLLPPGDGAVIVDGDSDRLHQVVSNLLINACKYSPADSAISLELRCSGGRVFIEVCDQGPGIDPAFHARIFDAFYRGPGAGGGGLGLGLYLCRELVERHQGKLSVRSVPGAGCRFTVELPRAA